MSADGRLFAVGAAKYQTGRSGGRADWAGQSGGRPGGRTLRLVGLEDPPNQFFWSGLKFFLGEECPRRKNEKKTKIEKLTPKVFFNFHTFLKIG